MQNWLTRILSNDRWAPLLVAISAGMYPVILYYSNNFNLVNSWSHFAFFLGAFISVPALVFYMSQKLFSHPYLKKWKTYVLPFLSLLTFLFLLKICLYTGLQKKMILGIVILSAGFAFFLHRHFKKLLLLQIMMAVVGIFSLTTTLMEYFKYSELWQLQPDAISDVIFKKTPNVYFIQPDGYVNFSEMDKGYYQIENDSFKHFLTLNNFKNYPNFRSNYEATLTSNSASFVMKHHYYEGSSGANEALKAREIIVSKNPVLDIFKRNGYQTYFLTEYPYLIINRPKMGYDVCNFEYSEIPFLGTGMETYKDVLPALEKHIADDNVPKFFFIEIFSPKHISGSKSGDSLAQRKRDQYILDLKTANEKLMATISIIKNSDPNGLIILMSDHGGYVGMEYLQQGNEKTEDRDKLYSMFSSMLSIHWPNNEAPVFDEYLRSSVNVFRILFSYLSDDNSYLEHLEKDASYGMIYNGAPPGVYEFIDANGNVSLKEIRLFNE